MGIVLNFRAGGSDRARPADGGASAAQIIIFPGVRYERTDAKPSLGWSPVEWLTAQQNQPLPQS